VNLTDEVEQIFSALTLPPVVGRILGDALSGLDEVAVVSVAIEHDPSTYGNRSRAFSGICSATMKYLGHACSTARHSSWTRRLSSFALGMRNPPVRGA
jgi:hypothetical protein